MWIYKWILYIYLMHPDSNNIESKQLTELPIDELGLTPEFSCQSGLMGFRFLKDILCVKPEELIRMEGFTFHWLGELISFLHKNKLLYLLQPIPGKSVD